MSHKTVGRKLANVDRDLNSSSWNTSNYLALLIKPLLINLPLPSI